MSLVDIDATSARRQMGAPGNAYVPACEARAEVRRVSDDLSRQVYCVVGIPIDAIDMSAVLQSIRAAVRSRNPFLISTANLNFLVNSGCDPEFRESLLESDLCTPDGMPIVWIARLLGLPVKNRVSGSGLFEELKTAERDQPPLKLFLFGGAPGVAATAAEKLNEASAGIRCVGAIDPGFGTVEELSWDALLAPVNASDADFLAVSLGAKKGQAWLRRNGMRLRVPVRAHLGAVMNFQAGTIRRAPLRLQSWGLEWLWRIREEPYLWTRYWDDGRVLLRLLFTQVLPLALASGWHRATLFNHEQGLVIRTTRRLGTFVIRLRGFATERHIRKAIACFGDALTARTQCVTIDLSETRFIDPRFFGLLLMLRKQLNKQQGRLTFTGAPHHIERLFRLNALGFLLASEQST